MDNLMGKKEYLMKNLIYFLFSFGMGKTLILRCISNYAYFQTIIMWLLIHLVVFIIGMGLAWKRERNTESIIENVVVVWGIYVTVAYFYIFQKRIMFLLGGVLISSILLTVVVLFRKIRGDKTDKKRVIKRRIYNVFILWRRHFAIAFLFLIIPLLLNKSLYGTIINADVDWKKEYDGNYIENNIELISQIEPRRWLEINDVEEKLTICQAIIESECNILGIPFRITVGMEDLEKNHNAYYSHKKRQIVVSTTCLCEVDSYKVLEALLHECFHAYQHAQVEMYLSLNEEQQKLMLFNEIPTYINEINNYTDAKENYEQYLKQQLERHARDWAEIERWEYVYVINKYLKKGGNA